VLAYSIKTNPLPELLRLARGAGMWAEAISQPEASHAAALGFGRECTILNGPAKWWPEPGRAGVYGAIFCDSLEELSALTRRVAHGDAAAGCIGVRLRPATVASRFGVDLSEPGAFAALVGLMKRLPRRQAIGFHFHHASSMVGIETWRYLAHNFIAAAGVLGRETGRRPAMLSFGGGWHPEDWGGFLRDDLDGIVAACRSELRGLRQIVLEPGKALAQPSMCLLMRVLEVRRAGPRADLVVDGSVAELPDPLARPHRIVSPARGGAWRLWKPGAGRLLGRLCMEFDVVADQIEIPRGLRAGDALAVLDAGGYDASMAYAFSRGHPARIPGPGTL
jgi:diaminopimelate decarboxylase